MGMSEKDKRARSDDGGSAAPGATGVPGKGSRSAQRYGGMQRKSATSAPPAPVAAPVPTAAPAPVVEADDPFALHEPARGASAPAPMAAGERQAHLDPERVFEGVGDQDALWERFEAIVEAGVAAAGVTAMVLDMDSERRAKVKAGIDELVPIVVGDELLAIAEIVGVLPREGLLAALSCALPPTAGRLRSFLGSENRGFVAAELDDAIVTSALQAVYPGSPVAILPDIVDLLDSEQLRRWFFAETSQLLVARTLLRAEDPTAIAARLTGRGDWTWVSHVTDAMTSMNPDAVAAYAAACPEPDFKAFLEAKHAKRESAGDHVGHERELRRELRSKTVDPQEVIDELAVIEWGGAEWLDRPDQRKKFVARASAQQIDEATTLAGLAPVERLRWMVDGPRVQLGELRDAVATWSHDVRREAIDPSLVKAIRRRWPDAAPADIYGRVPDTVPGQGASDVPTRTWIVERGTPQDIIDMLVISPGRTAELCAWMSGAGGGWDWLDRMGAGADDLRLRKLMLRCGDPALVERIQTRLVGDYIPAHSERVNDVGRAPRAEADPNQTLERHVGFERDGELAQTVGELEDVDVRQLHAKPEQLAKVLERTKGSALVRVLYAADVPLRALLLRPGITDENVLDRALAARWVRGRSGDDVATALGDQAAASTAQALWSEAPLEYFPQLRQPETMAKALGENPYLLPWIVMHSEPISALHALGAGKVSRVAAEAFGDDSSLVEWLPSGQLLSSRDRSYLHELARHATGRAQRRLKERIGADSSNLEDSDVDPRVDADARAERAALPLAEALETMLVDGSPLADLLGVCRTRAGDAKAALDDERTILRVIERANLAPTELFPGLALSAVLARAAFVEPTLDRTPPFVLIAACASDATLASRVARGLNGRERPFVSVANRIPAAAALSADEEAGLEALCPLVTNAESIRALFKARFGSGISESYDTAETKRLWRVMARLPQSHVEHGQVSRFNEILAGSAGPEGQFDPASKSINMEDGLITDGDGTDINDRSITNEWESDDQTALMTTAEMMQVFELTEEQIKERVKAGVIEKVGDKLRLAPVNVLDRFTAVALHEIGHAVDDRTGQTSFTNGLAGWRQFGDADYESWARELGGWDDVAPGDQQQILEAWKLWTNSSRKAGKPEREISKLVEGPHPIKKPEYRHVGIVALALDGFGDSHNPYIANGRAYTLNGFYQQRYSLPLSTMHAAPSAYALTAPGEYFAECYMTYYLTYDGSVATAKEKGKLLAPWIKRWFDEHIDALGETPKRT